VRRTTGSSIPQIIGCRYLAKCILLQFYTGSLGKIWILQGSRHSKKFGNHWSIHLYSASFNARQSRRTFPNLTQSKQLAIDWVSFGKVLLIIRSASRARDPEIESSCQYICIWHSICNTYALHIHECVFLSVSVSEWVSEWVSVCVNEWVCVWIQCSCVHEFRYFTTSYNT